MEFVAGKGLRVTGLIEFIVLCLQLLPQLSYSSTDHESPKYSVVGVCISLLGFGLMFPVLYFLRVDTRTCNDNTITLAFWVTVAVFICACVKKAISKVSEFLPSTDDSERGIDSDEAQYMQEKESRLTSRLMSCWDRLSEVSLILKVLGLALFIVFGLFTAALSVFFFVTLFKLAIPGDYITSCRVIDSTSKVLVLAIPCTALIVAALGIIHECVPCLPKSFWSRLHLFREDSAKRRHFVIGVGTVLMILMCIANVTLGIFVGILTSQVTRIWQGQDINLYEFFALSAALPALL